jgi:secreted Zn-dependent insulinase-like peptidase
VTASLGRYRTIPVAPNPVLVVSWVLPSIKPLWRRRCVTNAALQTRHAVTRPCSPERLLSFCLCVAMHGALQPCYRFKHFCRGHEGQGSVLALLKTKGWAQDLSAGFSYVICKAIMSCDVHHLCRSYSLNEFAVFKCTIKLTDAGAQHWELAVALVLRYMHIMRNTPLDKLVALYDEQTAIDTADFQYQSRQTEETYVDKLSNALFLHPAHLVLYARLCCVEPVFDFSQFSLLLQYFTCSNMRVHFTAPLSQQPDPSLPWLSAPWHAPLTPPRFI